MCIKQSLRKRFSFSYFNANSASIYLSSTTLYRFGSRGVFERFLNGKSIRYLKILHRNYSRII